MSLQKGHSLVFDISGVYNVMRFYLADGNLYKNVVFWGFFLQHFVLGYVFMRRQGMFEDILPSLHLLLAEHERDQSAC